MIARFRPGPFRRGVRSLRNWVGTVQDAFGQAIGVFIGQVQKSNAVLKTQKGSVQNFGNQIIGITGNAWEPMLERLLGKPVVVELQTDTMTDGPMVLSGYLAEYSSKYIALFTAHKAQQEPIALTLGGDFSHPAFELTQVEGKWMLKATGLRPWVIERQEWADGRRDLGSILINGSSLPLNRYEGSSQIWVRELIEVDAVLSRSFAAVRFSGAAN